MKTIALISTMIALPAASLLAQGQSDFDALRSRITSAERRIDLLEREVRTLRSGKTSERAAAPKKASPTAKSGEYIVVKGDVLSRIASRHKTSVASLKKANGLRNDNISIGQKLRVPSTATSTTAPSHTDKVVASKAPTSSSTKHVVKSGETFYSIARTHKVSTSSLIAANPNVSPKSLNVGQQLKIDGNAKAAPVSRAVAKKKSTPKAKAPSRSVAKAPTKKPASTPVSTKSPEPAIRTITVHDQMTYGQFAGKYGASTTQLNALNGLSLSKSTMLAKGSELYVPKN